MCGKRQIMKAKESGNGYGKQEDLAAENPELYVMTKRMYLPSIYSVQNVFETDNKSGKYGKQKLIHLEGEIDKSAVILGAFHALLSTVS